MKKTEPQDIELQNVPQKPGSEVPKTVATTSKDNPPIFYIGTEGHPEKAPQSKYRRILKCLYNREEGMFCGRTCFSWLCIILYSFMYLIFLSTYTMIFLYISLTILKHTTDYAIIGKPELLVYDTNGIGLSGIPTSQDSSPLLWFASDNHHVYVSSIDKLLDIYRRKGADLSYLGPCAVSPYGYNENPCLIFRINKQFKWAPKTLSPNSSNYKEAPAEVQEWAKKDKKYWVHCTGSNHYDKEHSGLSTYYPDPPGIDPTVYPINMDTLVPLVAIQITNYTAGVSLAIECKLWYDGRSSLAEFQFYRVPTHSHYTRDQFLSL